MSSTSNTTPSNSTGASVGQKVKGAFQTVHGIGESIRGNALDFIDSATGTERNHHGFSGTEHDATTRGREETSVGISNMEGGHHAQTNVPVDKSGAGDVDEVGTGTTARGEAPGGSAVGLSTGRAGAV